MSEEEDRKYIIRSIGGFFKELWLVKHFLFLNFYRDSLVIIDPEDDFRGVVFKGELKAPEATPGIAGGGGIHIPDSRGLDTVVFDEESGAIQGFCLRETGSVAVFNVGSPELNTLIVAEVMLGCFGDRLSVGELEKLVEVLRVVEQSKDISSIQLKSLGFSSGDLSLIRRLAARGFPIIVFKREWEAEKKNRVLDWGVWYPVVFAPSIILSKGDAPCREGLTVGDYLREYKSGRIRWLKKPPERYTELGLEPYNPRGVLIFKVREIKNGVHVEPYFMQYTSKGYLVPYPTNHTTVEGTICIVYNYRRDYQEIPEWREFFEQTVDPFIRLFKGQHSCCGHYRNLDLSVFCGGEHG